MKILGFSGRRGSGKTTAAKYVQDRASIPYWGYPRILGFFDTAKEWYRRGMGLPADVDWSSQEFKDAELPNGKTHRHGLVRFGMECREHNPEWWINVWSSIVDELDEDPILVPDVRFPNELAEIHRRGGHVIRLLRAPHPEDVDETETALDEIERGTPQSDWYLRYGETDVPRVPLVFDAVVNNRKMSQDQMCETVWQLVKERGWV